MASKITLKVKLNPNGTIECSWPPVSGVKEYMLIIKRTSDKAVFYKKITTKTSCVTTSTVMQGMEYDIDWSAHNAKGSTLAFRPYRITVPSDFYVRNLTAPSNVRVTASTTSVQVSFGRVSAATSYDILFDGRVYNTTQTSYTFSGLIPNSTHTLAVRSKNSVATGAYSATQTVLTKGVIPSISSFN